MSFVYTQFLRAQNAGLLGLPGTWLSFNLALVTAAYTPDRALDTTFADIPGGAIAADGMTGTFPTFTIDFNGSGATPEAGIRLVLTSNSWGAVAAGAPVVAAVLYAIVSAGPTTGLVAYYDAWGGLPFTPDGSVINILSLPTPLQASGVNMVRDVAA